MSGPVCSLPNHKTKLQLYPTPNSSLVNLEFWSKKLKKKKEPKERRISGFLSAISKEKAVPFEENERKKKKQRNNKSERERETDREGEISQNKRNNTLTPQTSHAGAFLGTVPGPKFLLQLIPPIRLVHMAVFHVLLARRAQSRGDEALAHKLDSLAVCGVRTVGVEANVVVAAWVHAVEICFEGVATHGGVLLVVAGCLVLDELVSESIAFSLIFNVWYSGKALCVYVYVVTTATVGDVSMAEVER